MMQPEHPLPGISDPDSYIPSMLSFVTTNPYFRTFCGGVHILDFFTSSPPLYETSVPSEWRIWFASHPLSTILDVLLAGELRRPGRWSDPVDDPFSIPLDVAPLKPPVPASLLGYLNTIRSLNLCRAFSPLVSPSSADPRERSKVRGTCGSQLLTPEERRLAVGMSAKKAHEVMQFSAFVARLVELVGKEKGQPITHIVDFGSGQNYLGRTLANRYGLHVIGVEGRETNILGSRGMDVTASLATKDSVLWDKKSKQSPSQAQPRPDPFATAPCALTSSPSADTPTRGSLTHVHASLTSGDLSPILSKLQPPSNSTTQEPSNILVVSLHSCGDLSHHALRSLQANPLVSAVAVIGCCYNLLTEHTPPPSLSPFLHTRSATGFPMSSALRDSKVGLNVTARMLAVQAPYSWTHTQSSRFFVRHYYRALLQRILLDRGIVGSDDATSRLARGAGGRDRTVNVVMSSGDRDATAPTTDAAAENHGERDKSGATEPLVLGTLPKAAYGDFKAYVRAAVHKLLTVPTSAIPLSERKKTLLRERMAPAVLPDDEIEAYLTRYGEREKELQVLWSLMAVSATVVESLVLVDRWCWLVEQGGGERQESRAWVQSVFEYHVSPRNMAVVGIKGKNDRDTSEVKREQK